jgi:hypothetical protein
MEAERNTLFDEPTESGDAASVVQLSLLARWIHTHQAGEKGIGPSLKFYANFVLLFCLVFSYSSGAL